MLIEHLDGAGVPIMAPSGMPNGRGPEYTTERAWRYHTTKALISRGMIETDGLKNPKLTYLTEGGRRVLAFILAEWADALIRAGYDGLGNPPLTLQPASSPKTSPSEEPKCDPHTP